jgi:hypothetical protein
LARHPPHLTVLALRQLQFEPRRRNVQSRPDWRIAPPQAGGLIHAPRLGDVRLQRAFASEHKQPFTARIEPPRRIHAADRDVILKAGEPPSGG